MGNVLHLRTSREPILRMRLPCSCGEISALATPGVHLCRTCREPALVYEVVRTHNEVRKLHLSELRRLEHFTDAELDYHTPADLDFICRGQDPTPAAEKRDMTILRTLVVGVLCFAAGFAASAAGG